MGAEQPSELQSRRASRVGESAVLMNVASGVRKTKVSIWARGEGGEKRATDNPAVATSEHMKAMRTSFAYLCAKGYVSGNYLATKFFDEKCHLYGTHCSFVAFVINSGATAIDCLLFGV